MTLKKNIVGLRRQLQDHNETIKGLRTHIKEQEQLSKELRKMLAKKLRGK